MRTRFFTLNKSDLKFALAGAVIGLPFGAAFGAANSMLKDLTAAHDNILNYGVMTSAPVHTHTAQYALKHDRDAFILDEEVYYNRKSEYSSNKDFMLPLVVTMASTAALSVATRRFGLFAKATINLVRENHSFKNKM